VTSLRQYEDSVERSFSVVPDLDGFDPAHPSANDVFEAGTARTVRRKARLGVGHEFAPVELFHVGAGVGQETTLCEDVFAEPQEQTFQGRTAGFEQCVGVTGLWRTRSGNWFRR